MQPVAVLCPACQHRLRVRERAFLNRPIDCPACGVAIQIDVARDGSARVHRVEAPLADPGKLSTLAVPATDMGRSRSADFDGPVDVATATPSILDRMSPRTMAWGIALAVGCLAFGWAWWNRKVPAPARPISQEQAPGAVAAPVSVVPGSVAGSPAKAAPSEDRTTAVASGAKGPPAAGPRREDPINLLAARIESLGRDIVAFQDGNKVFPFAPSASLPPRQRLSWIATLYGSTARPGAHIELAWNAPENEPFVRRRRDQLLNPLETALVGDDGYPTTHFAGSAGVGANARRLKVDEPGAGAFGEDRRTTREDFRDGLAQTILVLGVNDGYGSWAANDQSTLRELTREPYVNGPDGLGTGQRDSMLVLMADGSVKTISAKTDGAVVRQMATLWDGAPSGAGIEAVAAVPTERPEPGPGAATPPAVEAAPAAADAPSDDKPAADGAPAVGEATDMPERPVVVLKDRLAIENALRRTVLKYEVAKPVERGLLARELADMAGIALTWNDEQLGERRSGLKEAVLIKTGPAEIGGILERLLAPAGLRIDARDGAAWIVPALAAPEKRVGKGREPE